MNIIYRAYITTFRPPKSDRAKRDAFGKKISYGVLVRLDNQEIGYTDGWIKSENTQYVEMEALSSLLDALDETDDVQLQIILNSDHLRTRLEQTLARLRKKQRNEPLSKIKKEARWEEAAQQFELMGHKINGMRERHTPEETAIIEEIKQRLMFEIYNGERLTGNLSPEFTFEFPNA
jgi:hypothetical protein